MAVKLRSRSSQPTRSQAAIAVHDVDFVYKTRTQSFQALTSINFNVPSGKILMIMGPAGAGKTTLLLILAGLLTPTAGTVTLLGQDITQLSRHQLTHFRLHNIGILVQDGNLLRSLTALENIETLLHLKGLSPTNAQAEAQRLLESVNLGAWANHLPCQLSGGQQQRVAVARAMAGHPNLLFADEPTASLDSENGQIVVKLIRQLARNEGCTAVIATHDPRITQFADRLLYLEDGRLNLS